MNDLARSNALRLMLTTGLTQGEIAKRVGVSAHTMSEWSKAGGWADLRRASKVTTAEIKTGMMMELEELRQKIQGRPKGERTATREESACRNDILLGINRLKNPVTVELMEEFVCKVAEFCGQKDPALAALVLFVYERYLSMLLQTNDAPPTLQEALGRVKLKAVRDDGTVYSHLAIKEQPDIRATFQPSMQRESAVLEDEDEEADEWRPGMVYDEATDEWVVPGKTEQDYEREALRRERRLDLIDEEDNRRRKVPPYRPGRVV